MPIKVVDFLLDDKPFTEKHIPLNPAQQIILDYLDSIWIWFWIET